MPQDESLSTLYYWYIISIKMISFVVIKMNKMILACLKFFLKFWTFLNVQRILHQFVKFILRYFSIIFFFFFAECSLWSKRKRKDLDKNFILYAIVFFVSYKIRESISLNYEKFEETIFDF